MRSKNSDSDLGSRKYGDERKIMLFDLSIRGHHPGYIQYLVRYWCDKELPGRLDIVVSPKFMQEHSDVVGLSRSCNQRNVNFIAIAPEEEAALRQRKSSINRAFRAFQEWHLFCNYADSLEATQCLIMYFDTCQLPIAFGTRRPTCPFSGIYFRPTFHYNEFANYVPSWKERAQRWQEKLLLSRVLGHPQLKTLFCLDHFVVKHIDQLQNRVKALQLPDPVQIYSNHKFQSEKLRERLGIHSGRQIFLLFGALTERKGVYQLLEAVLSLSPTLCQKLCLLLVGESRIEASLKSKIAAVCQSRPIQVIERYEFIPEQEVQAYFQLSDVVLAPYQQHIGMSGILLLAAAAQKPVLSSNYGLMGEIVQRYSLGLTVDSTVPDAIAKGLTRFLLESPAELCDRTKMKAFVEQNSAELFASTIFEYV